VYAKNFSCKKSGCQEIQGLVSLLILLDDGRAVRRHADHVKSRELIPKPLPEPVDTEDFQEIASK